MRVLSCMVCALSTLGFCLLLLDCTYIYWVCIGILNAILIISHLIRSLSLPIVIERDDLI